MNEVKATAIALQSILFAFFRYFLAKFEQQILKNEN